MNKNKIIKEILKRSSDFHNQFTPFEICNEMISKIEGLNAEMSILVMFNLEFIYILREKFGKEGMGEVWFMTPCETKKKAAIAMGVNENKVLTYSYNDKKIIGEENMPKFDVVVGNPPYKGMLHLEFLKLAYKLSKRWVIWINPSAWLIDERGTNKKYELTKKLISEKLQEITFFNGNPVFNVGLFVPFAISTIDKSKKTQEIKIIDKVNNIETSILDINSINKWNEYKIYPGLREKIKTLCSKDSFHKHQNIEIGNFYVNLSYVRGHFPLRTSDKMMMEDFYSFIPRDKKIEKNKKDKERGQLFFTFLTEKEAQNFISFLKTRWAMFSLSIFKIDQNLGGNFMGSSPWLDWSEPWTEERFEKLINATPEEIEFIHKNIPDYYNEKPSHKS